MLQFFQNKEYLKKVVKKTICIEFTIAFLTFRQKAYSERQQKVIDQNVFHY